MSVNPRQPAVLEAYPSGGGGVSWKKGFWMAQNFEKFGASPCFFTYDLHRRGSTSRGGKQNPRFFHHRGQWSMLNPGDLKSLT